MRTRRSVRNQNILYKQLFPAPPKAQALEPEPFTADHPVLFGKSSKRKAQLIQQRAQEIARWRMKHS